LAKQEYGLSQLPENEVQFSATTNRCNGVTFGQTQLNTMKQIILSLALLLSLFSCTIEKRLHRPGWHVEFAGRHNTSQNHSSNGRTDNAVNQDNEPELIAETPPSETIRTNGPVPALTTTDSLVVTGTSDPTPTVAVVTTEKQQTSTAKSFIPRQIKRIIAKPFKQKTDDTEPKQTSPLIIAMWVLNVILTAAFIILAIALLSGTSAYPLITAAMVFLFVTPVFLLGNIILGALAFKQRQKYPDKYRHSSIGLAMFGGLLLMIGGVLCVLLVSLLSLILEFRF
jgi:hypothetical protein